MSGRSQRLGRSGERVAARFLKRNGLRILERNRSFGRLGEIDLLAKDGEQLVIVEVKTRGTMGSRWTPEMALTPTKRRRLELLADTWIRGQAWRPPSVRIDLVAIEKRGVLRWSVRWYRSV